MSVPVQPANVGPVAPLTSRAVSTQRRSSLRESSVSALRIGDWTESLKNKISVGKETPKIKEGKPATTAPGRREEKKRKKQWLPFQWLRWILDEISPWETCLVHYSCTLELWGCCEQGGFRRELRSGHEPAVKPLTQSFRRRADAVFLPYAAVCHVTVLSQRYCSSSENILQSRRCCPGPWQGTTQDGRSLLPTTTSKNIFAPIVFYFHFSFLTRPYLSIITAISLSGDVTTSHQQDLYLKMEGKQTLW